MDNIKTLLNEEIEDELNELGGIKMDSEEYKSAVDGVTKLIDKRIELDKMEMEAKESEKAREHEKELKLAEIAKDKKGDLIRNVMTGVGIAVPAVLTVWGTLKSLKFEEEGTITTTIGRGFINKLLPKK